MVRVCWNSAPLKAAFRSAKGRLLASALFVAWIVQAGIAFAQEPAAPIQKLDDPTRARALAALAGLIILGFAMVLLTWLTARVVQRYRQGTSYFRPTPRPGEHDWARKPLDS
jgi:hypothetical protein